MNIKITSTNVILGDEVKNYAEKKISSLSKFLDNQGEVLCEIELAKTTNHHKSGDIYKAEVNMTYQGRQYFVMAEEEDLYVAIDAMRDELERKIVSSKKKYMTVFRHSALRVKDFIKKFYR